MWKAALFTILLGAGSSAFADRMPDPPPAPEALDRQAISAGMASIKAKISSCGSIPGAGGTVKANVVVGPDGRVTSATSDRPAGDKLGVCVIAAVKSIVFAKTQKGGSFSYPLVFGPAKPLPPEGPPPDGREQIAPPPADTFDRAAITAGIAVVKPRIAACGSKAKAGGTVKMRVVVGADGKVTSATAEAAPDPALGACVAAVMKTATFKKTPSGGSFSYPFVFGAPPPPSSPPPTGPSPPPTDPAANAGLDRSMISAGVTKVKAKISACGTGAYATVKGTVKIKVEVAPAGTVTAATVVSAPAEALGACVARVLKGATFAKTAQGGSFSYPFVF